MVHTVKESYLFFEFHNLSQNLGHFLQKSKPKINIADKMSGLLKFFALDKFQTLFQIIKANGGFRKSLYTIYRFAVSCQNMNSSSCCSATAASSLLVVCNGELLTCFDKLE